MREIVGKRVYEAIYGLYSESLIAHVDEHNRALLPIYENDAVKVEG